MLKRYLWLTLWLYITLRTQQVYGSDEREHVHIKVHMPDVLRKHKQPHKVFKQQYKRPQPLAHHAQRAHSFHSRPTKAAAILPTQTQATIDLGYYSKDVGGSGSHVAPYIPTHLPSVVAAADVDLTNNYGPVVFDNDIIPDKQPPTYTKYLQQFLTPDAIVALTNSGVRGGGDGGVGVSNSGSAAELIGDNMQVLNEYFHKYATAMQQLHQTGQSAQAEVPAKYQRPNQHQYQQQQQQQPHYHHNKRNKYGINDGGSDDYEEAKIQQYQPLNSQQYYFSDNAQYNGDDDEEGFEDASAENSSYSYSPARFVENEDNKNAATQQRDYHDFNTMPEYFNPTSAAQQQGKLTKRAKWKPFTQPKRQIKLPAWQYTDTTNDETTSTKARIHHKRHQQYQHQHQQQHQQQKPYQNYGKRSKRFKSKDHLIVDYF